jgi:uncharacterized membrane protein YvbJ
MNCPKCNDEIVDNSAFCSSCGASVEDAQPEALKEGEAPPPARPKKTDGGCFSMIILVLAISLVIAGIIGFAKGCS